MKKTFIAAVMLIAAHLIQAQTADEIIANYFNGIGGMDKWKSMKSMKMTGNMSMQQGEFPITLYRKAPDKFKVVVDVMGQQIIPQAFDGVTGWLVNPFGGVTEPQKMTDEEVKALKEDAAFEDPFIDYAQKGYAVTYEGTEDLAGIKCDVLKLVKNKGVEGEEKTSFFYFDTDSHLQLLVKQSSPQMEGQMVEVYLSDYQEAGNGLLMPFTLDTQMQGQSLQKLILTSIVVDEEMPDELFAFPVAVSAEPQ
jgi:outer membrane lipoprotein-sorting protein